MPPRPTSPTQSMKISSSLRFLTFKLGRKLLQAILSLTAGSSLGFPQHQPTETPDPTDPLATTTPWTPPKPYEFGFAVEDENNTNFHDRREVSDGQTIQGSYSVVEPDGHRRIVTYIADKNGFRAEVQRVKTHIKVKTPEKTTKDGKMKAPPPPAEPSVQFFPPNANIQEQPSIQLLQPNANIQEQPSIQLFPPNANIQEQPSIQLFPPNANIQEQPSIQPLSPNVDIPNPEGAQVPAPIQGDLIMLIPPNSAGHLLRSMSESGVKPVALSHAQFEALGILQQALLAAQQPQPGN